MTATFRLGRKKLPARPPMLRLKNYLLATLPPPPPTRADWYQPKAGLSEALGNDELGDCTCAGASHIEDVFRAGAKSGLPPITRAEAIALYSAACGYVPGDPSTDQGGTCVGVLSYWRQHGLLGGGTGRNAGWLEMSAMNQAEVEQGVYLFGNAYLGLDLPDAWVNPFPGGSGFVWDLAGPPDPANGHCIMAYGFNAQGLLINSWGLFGTMTWRAFRKYVGAADGEAYTVLSQDWINPATELAPSGFAFAALQADLASLA